MWGPAWDGPPEAGWYVGVQGGRMRRRRMVQTILTSVTAQTMGRHLSGFAQSPFL